MSKVVLLKRRYFFLVFFYMFAYFLKTTTASPPPVLAKACYNLIRKWFRLMSEHKTLEELLKCIKTKGAFNGYMPMYIYIEHIRIYRKHDDVWVVDGERKNVSCLFDEWGSPFVSTC